MPNFRFHIQAPATAVDTSKLISDLFNSKGGCEYTAPSEEDDALRKSCGSTAERLSSSGGSRQNAKAAYLAALLRTIDFFWLHRKDGKGSGESPGDGGSDGSGGFPWQVQREQAGLPAETRKVTMVNHIEAEWCFCRKDTLAQHLVESYTGPGAPTTGGGSGEDPLSFLPRTVWLRRDNVETPFELDKVTAAMATAVNKGDAKKGSDDVTFDPPLPIIIKPSGGACGRHITVLRLACLSQLRDVLNEGYAESPSVVVQQYVDRPLCHAGHKFDVRCYLLVLRSEKGLPVLGFYHDGYIRLCSREYEEVLPEEGAATGALGATLDPSIHLTNCHIQWMEDGFDPESDSVGGVLIRRPWAQFASLLETQLGHGSVTSVRAQMKNILTCTLTAPAIQSVLASQPSCGQFGIYGVDFLVDEMGKVWLIEIGRGAAMRLSVGHLRELHTTMIADMVDMVTEAQPYLSKGDPVPTPLAAVDAAVQRLAACDEEEKACAVTGFEQICGEEEERARLSKK